MITSRHFKEQEFNKCVPSCSLQDMNQGLVDALDNARDIARIPLVLNCAYRSPLWEKTKGRSGTGAHTLRHAVDIRCSTDRNRFKIINALILAGFTRIGISKTFIHADNSIAHDQDVIWLY